MFTSDRFYTTKFNIIHKKSLKESKKNKRNGVTRVLHDRKIFCNILKYIARQTVFPCKRV